MGCCWTCSRRTSGAPVNPRFVMLNASNRRRTLAEKFSVGLIQMSCSPEPDDNVARAVAHVRNAAKQGAKVICLPELFKTQYFCQREEHAFFDLAEPIPGPTTKVFSELSRDLRVTIVVSLFE